MKIKFICVSKNGKEEDTDTHGYTLQIALSEAPEETWKQYFYFICRRGSIIRRKMINIIYDEVIVSIENEKNIQEHIEILKKLILETNKLVRGYIIKCRGLGFADY